MKELFRRLGFLLRRTAFERELDEELRHHLALKSENRGFHQQIPFGNITLLKEESRAMWTFTFWEQFAQDIRYGLRAMAGNKLFTAMAVLSLALGIGANTAIYSFIDAILRRALPVSQPERLVILNHRFKGDAIIHSHWGSSYDEAGGSQTSPNFPYPAFELLRKDNTLLAGLWGHASAGRVNVVIDGQAELGEGEYVTGDYFSGLGVPPAAGRLIGRDDDRKGAPAVAVISYDYWRTRFASDPSAVGKAIQLNGRQFTVTGVAAPEFFGVSPDHKPILFVPMAGLVLLDPTPYRAKFNDAHYYWIELMGRLKPGVTSAQAQAQLAGLFHGYVESTVTSEREARNLPALWLGEGGSGVDALRRDYSTPLWFLMALVGMILAIACANVANLLLSRAASRRREMAVRLSLGAGRFRVMRQLLTESLMLAFLGAVAGIGVAALGIRFLLLLMTNGTGEFTVNVGLDWRVLGFTLLVTLVTGILFGLAPAIQATNVNVTPALKESRAGAPRGKRFGLSKVLVVSQIAFSLVLVAAAGLFVRSLANLHSVSLGFNSENILLFHLDATQAGYKEDSLKRVYGDLQNRFQGIPDLRGATSSDFPIAGGRRSTTGIAVPGIPAPPEGQRGPFTAIAMVGTTFFETLEIPILAGRAIGRRDVQGAPLVCVVNEVFAKQYFPNQNPVGLYFSLGRGKDAVDIEIAGLAKNARYDSLKRETPPVAYISWLQAPSNRQLQDMFFELRTTGDPMAPANTVRRIVHEASPQVPVADVTTQSRRIDQGIQKERIFAQLCTVFGILALVMACVGLYGTMAYTVARRTFEIGIRMALGAQRKRIVWTVLREVLALSGVGIAFGFIAVWQTTTLVKSFLFGMKPNDPLALGASTAVLMVCALLAGYLPARRASRIDPMAALRHE